MNREDKSNPIDNLNVNRNEINDKMKIAEYCNEYFTDIGKKLASEIPPSNSNVTKFIKTITYAKFKFKQITPIQVHKIISKLKNGKATGIHQMPNKLLRISKELISSSLARIFNQCIQANIFLDNFKVRCVTPIFHQVIESTLTITDPFRDFQQLREFLKSCYMSSCINISWIMRFYIRSGGVSALYISWYCTSDWLLNIDRDNVNTVVFLDIKNAFDTIDHSILLNNLRNIEYVVKSFCFLNRTS